MQSRGREAKGTIVEGVAVSQVQLHGDVWFGLCGRAIVNMLESDIVVLVIKLLVIWAREMASAMFLL